MVAIGCPTMLAVSDGRLRQITFRLIFLSCRATCRERNDIIIFTSFDPQPIMFSDMHTSFQYRLLHCSLYVAETCSYSFTVTAPIVLLSVWRITFSAYFWRCLSGTFLFLGIQKPLFVVIRRPPAGFPLRCDGRSPYQGIVAHL